MARLALVTDRKSDPIMMVDMPGALAVGDFVEVPDDLVLTQPGWTLFSFDLANDVAVFVDIGADTDLAAAPFSYHRQYEQAKRVLRMPVSAFLELAEKAPAARSVVHLINIGHCGSTLLHNVFNASGQGWCLSEPLFTFDLAMNRAALPADRLAALWRAAMRMLRVMVPPEAAHKALIVKHFSQITAILPAVHASEPDATFLYLTRHAEAWCNSLFGFHERLGGLLDLSPTDRFFSWKMMSGNTDPAYLDGHVDMAAANVTFDRLAAMAWRLHRARFDSAVAAGMPLNIVRYEALLANPQAELERLFAICGMDAAGIAPGITAFAADSHEGSATAHSRPVALLSPEALDRIRNVVG